MDGSVQQQEQKEERNADDAVSANMFASEVEKTEDLLLSPERLLDQAKGEELFLRFVCPASYQLASCQVDSQPRKRIIDDLSSTAHKD